MGIKNVHVLICHLGTNSHIRYHIVALYHCSLLYKVWDIFEGGVNLELGSDQVRHGMIWYFGFNFDVAPFHNFGPWILGLGSGQVLLGGM